MTRPSPSRIAIIVLTVAAATAALASPAAAASIRVRGPGLRVGSGAWRRVVRRRRRRRCRPLQGGGEGEVVVDLPGVTDIAPVKPSHMWAIAGRKLFDVNAVKGKSHFMVGLGKFERNVNPDGGAVDSNPFDVTAFGTKRALIADAGANAVLIANRRGGLDWIATLPDEVVSTDNVKTLAGCPDAPPEFAEFCELPDKIPAQGVATSVAIGPDGAYYISELKGFPGTPR